MEAPTGGGIELARRAALRRRRRRRARPTAREEIDALNVYPVPDGDTGTNMYLTSSAARDAMHEAAGRSDADLGAALAAFAPRRAARRPRQLAA